MPEPSVLADLITAKLFEIEDIEKRGADTMIDFKVLADRASYCYSHKFAAREIAVLLGATYAPIEFNDVITVDGQNQTEESAKGQGQNQGETQIPAPIIENKEKDICKLYIGRHITSIQNGPSPKWLTDFLETVGQRSINLIVDLTNFVMLDSGQPMHAFDAKKVDGNIVVRLATEGESIELLDGRVVTLDSSTLVIADSQGPLAIAGVKGGKRAEVTLDTTDIILESANFNPVYVRKASQKYNIKNDSTKRFENAVSLERVAFAITEFCALLKAELPNIKVSPSCEVATEVYIPKTHTFNVAEIIERIGVSADKIDEKFIVDTLNSLDLKTEINPANKSEIIVEVPQYRVDIQIKEDIVDEIGRMYGYENLQGNILPPLNNVPVLPSFYYSQKIRDALTDLGFSELYTYTLVKDGDYALANPLNVERGHLRNTISDNFISVLQKNSIHLDYLGIDKVAVFEIGKVFEGKRERLSLAIGVTTKEGKNKTRIVDAVLENAVQSLSHIFNIEASRFPKSIRAEGIIEIDLESLIASADMSQSANAEQADTLNADAGTSMGADISAGTEIGTGMVTGIDNTAKDGIQVIQYKKISPYPYIIRDVAVFIPGPKGNADKVRNLIDSLESPLITSIRQFDEFEKNKIAPDGSKTDEVEKTSYAFRLVFQSMEKTLTDDEVQPVMDALTQKITDKTNTEGWEAR